MNFWFWLFVILPPVLVFSVKPQASAWLQATRLILAIALASYTFLAGAIRWQAFWLVMEGPHPCFGGLIETDPLILETCKSFVYFALYSDRTFYIFFSCIFAAIYVGLNEAIWRIAFRRANAQLGGSHFLSNILLISIAPVLIFVITCILFLMFHWLSPKNSTNAMSPPCRMNYWFWCFIILLPVLVFSIKPEANIWPRVGRLATAIALGYLLLNAGAHWGSKLSWEAYEACHRLVPNGDQNGVGYGKCKHLLVGTGGLNFVFALLLGWIPAGAYAGGWELLWRIYYRRRIRKISDSFGEWVSNILLILSFPVWGSIIYVFYHLAIK